MILETQKLQNLIIRCLEIWDSLSITVRIRNEDLMNLSFMIYYVSFQLKKWKRNIVRLMNVVLKKG